MSGILDGNPGNSPEQTINVSVGVVVNNWGKGDIGKGEVPHENLESVL